MLIEIVTHTPPWVFVLFFALLGLGWFQSKGRSVSRGKLLMLPVAMIALSFYGVLSAFGPVPAGLAFWGMGAAISAGLGARLAAPRGASFSAETRLFFVPGSWLPLALMMAIFFTKYAVGVVLARQLPIAGESAFVGSISLCYGLFSGAFLARAIVIWRCATHRGQHHA